MVSVLYYFPKSKKARILGRLPHRAKIIFYEFCVLSNVKGAAANNTSCNRWDTEKNAYLLSLQQFLDIFNIATNKQKNTKQNKKYFMNQIEVDSWGENSWRTLSVSVRVLHPRTLSLINKIILFFLNFSCFWCFSSFLLQ